MIKLAILASKTYFLSAKETDASLEVPQGYPHDEKLSALSRPAGPTYRSRVNQQSH